MSYFQKREPKPASKFSFWQVHHYFTGYIAFILFGFLSFYGLFVWSKWLVSLFAFGSVISLWVIIDDWLQHYIQRGEIEKTGYYKTVSFWHWWPYWLGRKLGLKV